MVDIKKETYMYMCVFLTVLFTTVSGLYQGSKDIHYTLESGLQCIKCSIGTYLKEHCIVPRTNATCLECPNGTFNPDVNQALSCIPCKTVCESKQLVPIELCTDSNDLRCECPNGTYNENENLTFDGKPDLLHASCRSHSLCKPGTGLKQQGTAHKDTVCEDCIYGKTYSVESSVEPCKRCKVCINLNYAYFCNITNNTICTDTQSMQTANTQISPKPTSQNVKIASTPVSENTSTSEDKTNTHISPKPTTQNVKIAYTPVSANTSTYEDKRNKQRTLTVEVVSFVTIGVILCILIMICICQRQHAGKTTSIDLEVSPEPTIINSTNNTARNGQIENASPCLFFKLNGESQPRDSDVPTTPDRLSLDTVFELSETGSNSLFGQSHIMDEFKTENETSYSGTEGNWVKQWDFVSAFLAKSLTDLHFVRQLYVEARVPDFEHKLSILYQNYNMKNTNNKKDVRDLFFEYYKNLIEYIKYPQIKLPLLMDTILKPEHGLLYEKLKQKFPELFTNAEDD